MIEGTAGEDEIRAQGGADVVRPIGGPDGTSGGKGNDNIVDSSNQNTLEEEQGNGRLQSGSFSLLIGVAGVDRINAANGSGTDGINRGPGRDTVTFDANGDEVKNCEIKRPQ